MPARGSLRLRIHPIPQGARRKLCLGGVFGADASVLEGDNSLLSPVT